MANAPRNYLNAELVKNRTLTDCRFHATPEQTRRAARAGGRVGGHRCYRVVEISDLSRSSSKSLATGNYYAVYERGIRFSMPVFKSRDEALASIASRNAGRGYPACKLYLVTPVSAA